MREVINFNKKWAFSKETKEVPLTMPENWYWVSLPHTWNAIDGTDGNDDYYRGTCYYAKELKKEELPIADRYYFEINGANSSADFYMNGKKLTHHDGGYSTWRIDITDCLEDKNLIVIAVDNSANETVYPQSADFTFYGGLYRDVNIICTNNSHFDLDYYGGTGIKVTPIINKSNANVEIEVFLKKAQENQKLVYTIKDKNGEIVGEENTSNTTVNMEIPNVHLWNGRKDPYLYTVEVKLQEDEEILDNIKTRFGCRTFKIDAKKGFILNGESYPLRGVARHQDRLGFGNALLPEHHKEDIDLICEMGANTVRLGHYQHDQYFYDLCDEKGLIVWAEIPYISKHMETGRENTIFQMKELIIQNYNHPSIIVWGLSNEITIGESSEDLLENHRILNDMVHEMDKTRLTTIACVSMCDIHNPYIQIPDVVCYNHYFGWYSGNTSDYGEWFDNFHKEFPKIPIGISEYGCEALNWHNSNPMQGDYTEEYQAFYHEELIKQLYTRPYMWATYVWNMFDFGADGRNEGGESGQNHKGLVTFDRKYKKDAFYAYKAWLSDDPFVHICGKRYIDRVEDITKITVYSNEPEVELFVNGKSIGKQTSTEHFFYFQVPNVGNTVIVAKTKNCQDESNIRKVDTFNEEYRFKEKGAILNWFDVTQIDGYLSLNDKISDVLTSEKGKEVFENFFTKMLDGKKFDETMMQILEDLTITRAAGLLGGNITKEELLELNEKLNKIPKAN